MVPHYYNVSARNADYRMATATLRVAKQMNRLDHPHAVKARKTIRTIREYERANSGTIMRRLK